VREERKGPRVGSAGGSNAGFLKGAGLTSLAGAEIVKARKGHDSIVSRIEKPGRPGGGDHRRDAARNDPRPSLAESMRFSTGARRRSEMRWIRPLHFDPLPARRQRRALRRSQASTSGRQHRWPSFLGAEASRSEFRRYEKRLSAQVNPRPDSRAPHRRTGGERANDAKLALIEDAEPAFGRERRPQRCLRGCLHRRQSFPLGPLRCPDDLDAHGTKVRCAARPAVKNLANKFLLVSNLKPRVAANHHRGN